MIEHLRGAIFAYDALVLHKQKKDDEKFIKHKSDGEYREIVREKMMVVVLMKRSNTTKFTKLFTNIYDQHSFNIDVYPKTLHDTYELLEKT